MTDYPVGSVSAKLVLDTEDFKKQVEGAKEVLKTLTESLRKSSFKNQLKELKQLNKEFQKYSKNSKSAKDNLDNLQKTLGNQSDSIKMASRQYADAMKNLDAMTKSINRQITASKGFVKVRDNLNSISSSYSRKLSEDMASRQYADAKNTLNTIAKSMEGAKTASRGYQSALNDLNNITKSLHISRLTDEMNQQIQSAQRLASVNNQLKQSYYGYRKSLPTNYIDYLNYTKSNAQPKNPMAGGLGTGYGQYLTQINGVQSAMDKMKPSAESLALSFSNVRSRGSGLTAALGGLKSSLSTLSWVTKGVAEDLAIQLVHSIINSTTEAIKNRSEMNSMLKQMKLTGAEVNRFNTALDKTVASYQKMNKYSLGETVASLGVEFGLNAKEMEKAMPVVSMVQSEYIRAGRTAEEASLAVKDVLQGEFQRLSRETGVGKDELLANGWDGSKTNLTSLLGALEKIGKSRHWDTFAQKATSLNDIVIITTNRITEMIAQLESYISPVLTTIFNSVVSILTGFSSWFNGLDISSKIFGSVEALIGVLGTVGTAIAMYRTQLGLAQLAQLGLKQSILATIFGIKAEEIATYKALGVQNASTKAIIQKITGYDKEIVATMSAKRALASYVLGLDAAIVKEYGFKTALIGSKLGLLDNEKKLKQITKAGLKWHQTLAVLTQNVDVATAKSMNFAQSLKAILTSMVVAKVILFTAAIAGLALVFGSLWSQCEKAKKAVEGFEDISTNGQEYINSANNTVKYYEGLQRSAEQHKANAKNATEQADAEKYLTSVNKELAIARQNVADAEAAYAKAKQIKQEIANKKSQIDIQNQEKLAKIYEENGVKSDEARTKASTLLAQVDSGAYYLNKGLEAYANSTREGLKHAEEHTKEMEKQNISLEARKKYMDDYNAVVVDTAYKWKQFAEGDMWAGVGAVWGELVKFSIDIQNNKDFVKLAEELGKTWTNLQPTIRQLSDAFHYLIDALIVLLQYGARFSSWLTQTQLGQYAFVSTLGLIGAGLIALKIKSKGAIDALKKLGENAKSAYEKLKQLAKDGDVLDKVKDKLGKIGNRKKTDSSKDDDDDSDDSDDSTVVTTGKGKKKKDKKKERKKKKKKKKKKDKGKSTPTGKTTEVGLTEGILEDLKTQARFAVKAATGIAIAMGLITEAIFLLQGPLWALGATGDAFKSNEANIRKGAEALQFCSDLLMSVIPLALAFVITVIWSSRTGIVSTIYDGVSAMFGVALALLLVGEAILLLQGPLFALASTGDMFNKNSINIQSGINAINAINDALLALLPCIPLFIGGTLLAASILLGGAGGIITASIMVGIAGSLLLLSESIIVMIAPLASLALVGETFPDLSSINKGAEAIKVVGNALTAIGNAILPLLGVLTADFIAKLTTGGKGISDYIKSLGGDTGIISSMKDFASNLNNMEIPAVDDSKATQIRDIGNSIVSINEAVQSVQNAIGGGGIGGVIAGAIGSTPIGGMVNSVVGAIAGATGGYSSSIGGKLQELESIIKDIFKFNSNISDATTGGTADVSDATGIVTAISDAVKSMSSALDNAISTASNKGKSIGQALKSGVSLGMMGLSTVINTQLTNGFNYGGANARSMGQTVGTNAKNGFTSGFKIQEATDKELRGALSVLEGKKQYFYNKGYQLGQEVSRGYKDGMDIHSPGIMWRATIAEVNGIGEALSNTGVAYNSAKGLAEAVVSGYAPTMANFANNTYASLTSNADSSLGVMGLDPMLNQPALQQFQSDANMATSLSQNTATATESAFIGLDTVVGGTFNNLGTKVQSTFTGINTSATTTYTKMSNTTRTQMANMQSNTTKHINSITNSWRGMQNALINSAEYIRSQTSSKINQLESNMGSFWRKVQNPALLMGSAGGDFSVSSTRTPISNPVKSNVIRTMNSSSPKIRIPRGSFGAGGVSKSTGISNKFRARGNNDNIDILSQYLSCLSSGGGCYAGGWDFNWTDDIRQALLKWNTNFGAIYDPYLSVGKFENDDFPVRGIPEVCKGYIQDAISRTTYEMYFNSKTGGDPVSAYTSGSFNCYDGALIIMALASAFGFSSFMKHGSWDGVPHVWAHVNGIGDIDATAIQQGYGLTSPKVSGIGRRSSLKAPDDEHNVDKSLHITVNVDMSNSNVSDESVGNDIGDIVVDKIIDITGVNKNTGR